MFNEKYNYDVISTFVCFTLTLIASMYLFSITLLVEYTQF